MATKSPQFEESTKIHSSDELDDMLRKASRQKSALNEDDYDNFEEHTIIGPAQELAAKSMAVAEEPAPAPTPIRASTKNIVRRTGPVPVVARSSDVMPAVRAAGSLSELTPPPPPAPTDDDAFAPWDAFDKPDVDAASAVESPVERPTVEAPPLDRPSQDIEPPPVEPMTAAPAENTSHEIDTPALDVMSMPTLPTLPPVVKHAVVEQPVKKMRWGAIAWVMLLLVTIGAGSMAYMRIAELEHELAMTKSALEAAKVR